jgi:hypothetical protein
MSQTLPSDLVPSFAAKLSTLIGMMADRGYEFRLAQGVRTPDTQARYYCSWAGHPPEHIDSVVADLRSKGADYIAGLMEGHRDEPRHSAWLTNALPGEGWHQWGLAADCYYYRDGKLVSDGKHPVYKEWADAARSIGLTAGFYFSTPDAGHVQLPAQGGATDLYTWQQIDAHMAEMFGNPKT